MINLCENCGLESLNELCITCEDLITNNMSYHGEMDRLMEIIKRGGAQPTELDHYKSLTMRSHLAEKSIEARKKYRL